MGICCRLSHLLALVWILEVDGEDVGVCSKPHRDPDPSCVCVVLVLCLWDALCVPGPGMSCPAAAGSPTAGFHNLTRFKPPHLV